MGSLCFLRYCACGCSSLSEKTNDLNFQFDYLNHHFLLWRKGRGNCNLAVLMKFLPARDQNIFFRVIHELDTLLVSDNVNNGGFFFFF